MIREKWARLSYPALLDVVITPKIVSLQTWVETTKAEFDGYLQNGREVSKPGPRRRLTFSGDIVPGELPPIASGIYHNRLPLASPLKSVIDGSQFGPAYQGRYFRARSYSLIDLDDPSLGSGEKNDGSVWVTGIDRDGILSPFFNATAYANAEKMHPMRAVRNSGAPSAFFIYRPYSDMLFTECDITAKFHPAFGLTSNVEDWIEVDPDLDYLLSFDRCMPKFRVLNGGGNIGVDGSSIVEVEMVDAGGNRILRDCNLYLEETGGYLPQKRVKSLNGVAKFRVAALQMTKGDEFKVKVGFRHYTGLLDVHFKVM